MESSLWIGLRWTAYDRINKWTDDRDLTYSNFHPLLVGRRLSIPASVSYVSVTCGLLGTLASPVNDYIKSNSPETGDRAHLVECLSSRHRPLSLIPSTT